MTCPAQNATAAPAKLGGSKIAEYPEAFTRWRNGEEAGPLVAEVSATGGCNHGCLHCSYQQFIPYEERKSFIERAALFSFLEDFKAMGGVEVFFAGKGEPLLNPELPDYLRFGSDLGLDMVMSSNGVPLSERRMRDIMPHLKWVRFSVNGGDAATYASIHQCPPDDFVKLERNLTASCNERTQAGLRVKLAIQFIVYDQNIETAAGIIDLHRRVGTDYLFIRNVADRDGRFAQATPEILAFLHEVDDPPFIQVRWETFGTIPAGRRWSSCHGVNFRINMDHYGNIYPCSRNHVMPSVVGNIHHNRFTEIWRSEQRRAMTAEIESGAFIPLCAAFCDVSADNALIESLLKGDGE